ncbi:hypothetical protein [Streptomyces lateritius]|uniref:hypothetical protein n=1 Tax=Streptomyces lateritius TaxID=67313 RepID=UPI001671A009|nr:hypothetical protein [Streptomyces lateritius]GGU12217.1 hypothetical protein GCM10010272_66800 [Streptomyces lateritius]
MQCTLTDDPIDHGKQGDPMMTAAIGRRAVPHSSSPSVDAGKQVTRGKHGQYDHGTAGLIVREAGGQGRYVLTCAHVLGPPVILQGTPDADLVFSPELSTCCGAECNNPIGTVVPRTLQPLNDKAIQSKATIGQVHFAVDASLIRLDAKTNASNDVPKIGKLTGVRDLIAEWSLSAAEPSETDLPADRQIPVQKYGAKTQHTHGRITALKRVQIKEFVGSQVVLGQAWVFEVEAVTTAGQEQPVTEYKLDMERYKTQDPSITPEKIRDQFTNSGLTVTVGGSTGSPTLVVRGAKFSQRGDSGAPIVDDSRKVVGILTNGVLQPILVKGQTAPEEILTGRSQGVFIAAALKHLNVELLLPGQGTAGRAVAVPGMPIVRGGERPVDWSAVHAAWAALESSDAGRQLGSLVRRHMDEVRRLVHHNRRVMVTWHRHQGPAFVNTALRNAEHPMWPLPVAIDGVRPVDALRAMRDVLLAEGSAALRADIAAHQQHVLDLAQRTTSLHTLLDLPDLPNLPHLPDPVPPPGVRIVNAQGVPGVAGALVRDSRGRLCLLASHHVVLGGGARAGDVVWALPPSAGGDDAGPAEPVPLGHARPGHLGRVRFDDEDFFVDGALIELGGTRNQPDWLRDALARGWPTAVARPEPGDGVCKHGPATGLTEGTLLDVAYPDRPLIDGREWTAPGQLLVGSRDPVLAFSAPGDSGAALLDEQLRIVGLLWGATANGDGVACPVEPLLQHLDVTLVAGTTPADADRSEPVREGTP